MIPLSFKNREGVLSQGNRMGWKEGELLRPPAHKDKPCPVGGGGEM